MKKIARHILTFASIFIWMNCYSQFSFRRADADVIYKEAVKLVNQKKYPQALELTGKILKTDPDYADAKVLLTRIYMETGKLEKAREIIASVITVNPRYYDAWLYSINIALMLKRLDDALCYADEGLKYFPGDIDLMLKKLTVFGLKHNYIEGNDVADELYKKYNSVERVKLAYTDYYYNQGLYFKKADHSDLAKKSLNKATIAAPENADISAAIQKLEDRNKDPNPVLNRINTSLEVSPKSYPLLMKKLGELQEMKRYPEALDVLKQILNYYPSDAKARRLETGLRIEAAEYYTSMDPSSLYESVLEKDPDNKQALEKVVGISLDKGEFVKARGYINNGLKKNPLDLYLLSRKIDLAEYDKRYQEAATAAGVLQILQPSEINRLRLSELNVLNGQQLLGQQQYIEAEGEFEKALRANPSSKEALDGLVSCYTLQKDYTSAIAMLNRRLSEQPDDVNLLIKKSALLSEAGNNAEAVVVAEELLKRNPESRRLLLNYQDITVAAAKVFIQKEEYSEALSLLGNMLQYGPQKDGFNYMINILSLTRDNERALSYTGLALDAFPDDKELLLKRASVLSDLGRYEDAILLLDNLEKRYPYNISVRLSLAGSLLLSGKALEKNNLPDSALVRYRRVLALNPKDTLGLAYSSNLLIAQKHPDSALVVINRALIYYPQNAVFLLKRSSALEELGRYAEASSTADSLAEISHSSRYREYASLLKSKSLRNQFGLFHLHSSFESADSISTWPSTQIATVEYRRFTAKGSWALRVNYTARARGTGLQGEGEAYLIHNSKLYSYASLALSNDLVFPRYKLAYSLFKTLKGDTELEGGMRVLSVAKSTIYSPVFSISKKAHDFWFNFRFYGIVDSQDFYQTYNLTSRYYMNGQNDYISIVAALGTSPDDRSRMIEFPQLAGMLSRSAGAGYQKVFAYRNIIGLQATWIHQKISPGSFRNQYDFYLTFQRRF